MCQSDSTVLLSTWTPKRVVGFSHGCAKRAAPCNAAVSNLTPVCELGISPTRRFG